MCCWAVDATHFAAQLRPSNDLTAEELDELVMRVDSYLDEHPPVSTQVTDGLMDRCDELNNTRLLEQCQTARDKCHEALQLIHTRRVSIYLLILLLLLLLFTVLRSTQPFVLPGLINEYRQYAGVKA